MKRVEKDILSPFESFFEDGIIGEIFIGKIDIIHVLIVINGTVRFLDENLRISVHFIRIDLVSIMNSRDYLNIAIFLLFRTCIIISLLRL